MVYRLIISLDFIILDCKIDHEIPIILERPLLVEERALVNMEYRDIMFWVHNGEVSFYLCKIKKQLQELQVVFMMDVVDDEMDLGSLCLKN